jgi:hypothetical protein
MMMPESSSIAAHNNIFFFVLVELAASASNTKSGLVLYAALPPVDMVVMAPTYSIYQDGISSLLHSSRIRHNTDAIVPLHFLWVSSRD